MRNRSKKHFVIKSCSDLSLFKQIVLVISKILQIFGLQPQISKKNSRSLQQFLLTEGQNNFGNKIPCFSILGAHYVIDTINDLPGVVEKINERLAMGLGPAC